MKTDIHPQYYPKALIICACGANYTTGSTVSEIHVEICSACHPFYTGKQKLVDSARRVEKFQQRALKKQAETAARKGRASKKVKLEAKQKARKAKLEKEEK